MGRIHRFTPGLFPDLARSSRSRRVQLSIEDQIKAVGLPTPTPEYQFATRLGRKWAIDFAWPERRIALEVEGGTWGNAVHVGTGAWTKRGRKIVALPPGMVVRLGGRHGSGKGMRADAEKYNHLAILGWLLIRATTDMVQDGSALRFVEQAFAAREQEDGACRMTT